MQSSIWYVPHDRTPPSIVYVCIRVYVLSVYVWLYMCTFLYVYGCTCVVSAWIYIGVHTCMYISARTCTYTPLPHSHDHNHYHTILTDTSARTILTTLWTDAAVYSVMRIVAIVTAVFVTVVSLFSRIVRVVFFCRVYYSHYLMTEYRRL